MYSKDLFAYHIRRIIIEQSKRANVGHIGSALSVADILAALYGHVLNIPSPRDPERDRFVLSKGHAALALYAALSLKGLISRESLGTYCTDASLLGVHPERGLNGIDFSTGSLGHGLSMAAGAAYAARMQNSKRRVFVLVSDAECNEGSVWEAAAFSAQHKLDNLIVLVDLNGQQALGYTPDVLGMLPMERYCDTFGWDVKSVNGHDVKEIVQCIESLETNGGKPHVLVAHTTFGKGVSFMENQIRWHYLPMSDAEYQQAMSEIEAAK